MLRKAVVLFMVWKKKAYEPIGTGTFVFHDGKLLIVSAAHVFEDLSDSGDVFLHVGAVNSIFRLRKFKASVSNMEHVSMDRSKDSFDLGVMIVPDEIVDVCNGKILMIQEDMIENEMNRDHILFYQAIGYPAAKNRTLAVKAAQTNRLFSPEILVYSGEQKTSFDIPDKKFLDKYHVIFNWDKKKNFNDDGNHVNVPKPNGISGGLIQGCFDYVPHSNGLYPTCAAGIITERDFLGNAMVGTRFSTVFEWLKLHPEMLS
jgi:hypothetical protein